MFTPTIIPLEDIRDEAILIIDVDYRSDHAIVSGILIQDWSSSECAVVNVRVDEVEAYEPGSFYKRELPCIQRLLTTIEVMAPSLELGFIVIDGYVHLGENFTKPGLGAYLNNFLGGEIPIIGVAKTYFRGVPDETRLFRQGSTSPLFITGVGIDQAEARNKIAGMHGVFRLPSMLKYVDQCCRNHP